MMQKYAAALGIFTAFLLGAAKANELQNLEFMTGVWRNDMQGHIIEEWWMPAAGKTKAAAFRWATADKVIAIELVIISEEEDGVYLRFKHYSHDFIPWEKDEPNTYKLIDVENEKATFEQVSQNEKAPLYIIYALNDEGLRFRGTADPDNLTDDDLVLQFRKQKNAP